MGAVGHAARQWQDGKCEVPSTHSEKGKTMAIIADGIDLAKHALPVHGVDQTGRAALVRPSVAGKPPTVPAVRGAF